MQHLDATIGFIHECDDPSSMVLLEDNNVNIRVTYIYAVGLY